MYFGVWMLKGLKGGPAAPIETFARFQAGFLSSEDFHRFIQIFMDFHRFSWIFMDCKAAGLARPAGRSVWLPGFVGRKLEACNLPRSKWSVDFHGLLLGWLAGLLSCWA